ncbi:MAG: hypothetical protein ACT4QB_23110 [Gammaproteobacteria bacterium]
MNRFVLDCSVAMGWVFEDEADAYGDAVFQSLREAAELSTSADAPEAARR